MKPRVIFVEPQGVEANVFSHYLSLPLMGTLYLGTILHNKGYDVTIYNENILNRKVRLDELDADVLCLTSLTSTANRAYELARQFKAANPRGRVIMGGIHASFLSEEAAQFVDHVVIGEGEGVILDLIEYGSSERFIRGEMVKDLDDVPMPNFDLLAENYRMRVWPMMASRGCPHGCNFCTVTRMFGRKYRTVSVDRVIEEYRRAKRRILFIYDDNFAANRRRTHEILDRMLALDQKRQWAAQVRADAARDEELVRKMRRAGCCRVCIGFESINPDTLESLNKNQDLETMTRAIRVFHDHGIAIHGMFMFGGDDDSPEIFEATSRFCREKRIDTVQYMILTPLPGTEVYRRLHGEGRLLHFLWQYYDGMHAVFQPKRMSADALQKGMIDAFEDFYNVTQMLNEGLNETYYWTTEMLRRAMLFGSRPVQHSTLLKGMGIYLLKKWKRMNVEYFDYLRKLRLSPKYLGLNR
jgi:radical SAM superfamily enzyme YgiQ (UPF0313 family)